MLLDAGLLELAGEEGLPDGLADGAFDDGVAAAAFDGAGRLPDSGLGETGWEGVTSAAAFDDAAVFTFPVAAGDFELLVVTALPAEPGLAEVPADDFAVAPEDAAAAPWLAALSVGEPTANSVEEVPWSEEPAEDAEVVALAGDERGTCVFDWEAQAVDPAKTLMANNTAANRVVFIFLTPQCHIRLISPICQLLLLIVNIYFDFVTGVVLDNFNHWASLLRLGM